MKLGFLITARLKSSRLPLKILKDLNGRTVLERIIDRVKEVQNISEIVLCTSTNPQDKPLVDIALKNGIYYFAGSEDDVLHRLLDAAQFFNLDYYISITADNPLFSIEHSNLIGDTLLRHQKDFVKITGLPLGTAPYGLKTAAVKVVCSFKNIVDTEIWGPLIDRADFFDVEELKAQGCLNRPDLRLTLDYEEDYQLMRKVHSEISFNKIINLVDVVEYLDKHSEILRVNSNCNQRSIDPQVKCQLDQLYDMRREELLLLKKKIYLQS